MTEEEWRSEAMYLIGYAIGALTSVASQLPDEKKERLMPSIKIIEERMEKLK